MRKRQDEELDTVSAAEPLTLATNASSKLARYLSSRRGLDWSQRARRFSPARPGCAETHPLPKRAPLINDPPKLACVSL